MVDFTARLRRTNQSILQKLGMKERQLLKNIKQLKLKYFGHVVRHNNLEKLCLEGAVEGRRGRGRPRRRETQDISDWLGFSVREASILAQDRDGFRSAVWDASPTRIRHEEEERVDFMNDYYAMLCSSSLL
ncbi:eukaryotic translation initiation factor 3 subunit F [Elysia marginata]|uniref:Eukaryotic translation initiation factor 3 subunit F n=1 Tax=Elysia marginata TaxID=1093978 RepID=A0AAV4GC71_9GAST|nr:eukaryotic translation initiation factor 3 subunit F [Elysia marginata]